MKTRFPGLHYASFGPSDWRFTMDDGAAIGGIYPTKAALLADARAFAQERGFAPRTTAPAARQVNDRDVLVSIIEGFVQHLEGGGLDDGELASLIAEAKNVQRTPARDENNPRTDDGSRHDPRGPRPLEERIVQPSHCAPCAAHYGDDGRCDEGKPVASPHRAQRAQPSGDEGVLSAPPVEVMHCPVLSTGHLSREEAQRAWHQWPTTCLECEHGFVVYFGSLQDLRNTIECCNDGDTIEEAHAHWPGFLAVAAWAEKHEFEWVRFDQDGPEQPGLPTWEW